jgi:hypothetical protein
VAIGRHLPPQCMPCALGRLIPLFNPQSQQTTHPLYRVRPVAVTAVTPMVSRGDLRLLRGQTHPWPWAHLHVGEADRQSTSVATELVVELSCAVSAVRQRAVVRPGWGSTDRLTS